MTTSIIQVVNTSKNKLLKSSLKAKRHSWNSSKGRSNKGRITVWQRGGGHPRLYREVDLHRKTTNGITVGIEYDPNRSSFLARIFNPDTISYNYILAPIGVKKGDVVKSGLTRFGNGHSNKLKKLNTGTIVHNLSLKPGEKGQMLRSPGSYGKLLRKNAGFAQIKMRSGGIRWFDVNTIATIGIVGNHNVRYLKLRKAGQARWLGKRPSVRGVAMNPVDHPHGGGEGKTSGGRPSVTPWGKPTRKAR
uniref:ribosomal protein L2 n=1 Tax=Ishige okamurae TaxID=233772 RepID=UPI002E79ED6C|nr:ribosomal protein L2 [Ishige okamurae]WBP70202.1 ribosomal protein L2 [Ishige okamurae]